MSTNFMEEQQNYYASLGNLQEAHYGLLEQPLEKREDQEFQTSVIVFIQKGQSTGLFLSEGTDRRTAQGLIDYWYNELPLDLRKNLDSKLATFDLSLAPVLDDRYPPYRGLDSFREDNHEFFFGREEFVSEILKYFGEHRFLAIVGSSGSGKSSVVLAGLLPDLKAGKIQGSQDWDYFPSMIPGSDPVNNLAMILADRNIISVDAIPEHIQLFRENPYHLTNLLNNPGSPPVILIIDQFEETFTLCRQRDLRQAFVNNILNFVNSIGERHSVILTMRSDFESHLAEFPELQKQFYGAFRISALDENKLREIIVKPADKVGLIFERGLVENLIQEVLGDPAALPLLQFTLWQLWENRERNRVTWEKYRRLSGGEQSKVGLVLSHVADKLFLSLTPQHQATAKQILLRLVRYDKEFEVTSNRETRWAFHKVYDPGRVDFVLREFVQNRLLRISKGTTEKDDQFEVAHEALVRNWHRLVGWLEDDRFALRQRQRITEAAKEWVAQGRDIGALMRGNLLDESRKYKNELNLLEAEFLQASEYAVETEQREKEVLQREREDAKNRELEAIATLARQEAEQARKLAETERKANRRMRTLSVILAIMTLIAVVATFFALKQLNESVIVAQEKAELAENEREAKEDAINAQEIAEQAKDEAEQEKLRADQEADDANEAKLLAELAEEVARNAEDIARSRELAALSTQNKANLDLSLLLAIESVNVNIFTLTFEANNALRNAFAANQGLRSNLLSEHTGLVLSANWNTDINKPRIITTSSDHTAIIWDGKGTKIVDLKGHTDWVNTADWAPNNSMVVTGSDDGTAIIWDPVTGVIIQRLEDSAGNGIRKVDWSSDGKYIGALNYAGMIEIWDSDKGMLISTQEIQQHTLDNNTYIQSFAWLPNKTLGDSSLIVVDSSNIAELWNYKNSVWKMGENKAFPVGYFGVINSVMSNPDGDKIITTSMDGTARIWSLKDNEFAQSQVLLGHYASVTSAQWSPDGKRIVTSSNDDTARVWDANTGEEIERLVGHTGDVNFASWSPDGQLIVTASDDGKARIWELDRLREGVGEISLLSSPSTNSTALIYVKWSPTNDYVLTIYQDGIARIWNSETGNLVSVLGGETSINVASWNPDGIRLVTGGIDGIPHLWNVQTGEQLTEFQKESSNDKEIWQIMWNQDGTKILTVSSDGIVLLWDASDGKLLTSFPLGIDELNPMGDNSNLDDYIPNTPNISSSKELIPVLLADLSPDGANLVTAGADGQLRIYNLQNSKNEGVRKFINAEYKQINFISFDPTGTLLLTISDILDSDYQNIDIIKIWDVKSGELLYQIQSPVSVITSVSFNPASQRIICSQQKRHPTLCFDSTEIIFTGINGTVIKWKASTNDYLKFEGHLGDVLNAVWSSDGSKIITTGADSAILWDAETGDKLSILPGHKDWVISADWNENNTQIVTVSRDGTGRVYIVDPRQLSLEACNRPSRNLTYSEWNQYFRDVSELSDYKTCANLPIHSSFFDAASEMIARDEITQAIDLLDQMLIVDPVTATRKQVVKELIDAGVAFANLGDILAAEGAIQKAINLDPISSTLHTASNHIILASGDLASQNKVEEAKELITWIVMLDPISTTRRTAFNELVKAGYVLVSDGFVEESETLIDWVLDFEPVTTTIATEIWINLAQAFVDSSNFENVEDIYSLTPILEKAIRLEQSNITSHLVGQLLINAGRKLYRFGVIRDKTLLIEQAKLLDALTDRELILAKVQNSDLDFLTYFQTVFIDDFSSKGNDWLQLRDDEGITDFDQNGYRIMVDKTEWIFWSNPGVSLSDVIVDVDATKIGGPEENEFGVICRYVDENNFYFFTITSDGYFSVNKVINGEYEFIGMDSFRRATNTINPGNLENHLRVECIGNTFRFLVNGVLIFEAQDESFTRGDIGLLAGTADITGTDILFDDLIVLSPFEPTDIILEPGNIIFQDDFSNLTSGWDSVRDSTGMTDYDQGAYRIQVLETNTDYWANPGLSGLGDVSILVEVKKLAGPSDNDFAILCRYVDVNNFYAILVSSDGFYGIMKIVDGSQELIGQDQLQRTDTILQGTDVVNTIRADCIGNTLTLFINGVFIETVQDSTFTEGDVGLMAGTYDTPGTDILFDNFVVYRPSFE